MSLCNSLNGAFSATSSLSCPSCPLGTPQLLDLSYPSPPLHLRCHPTPSITPLPGTRCPLHARHEMCHSARLPWHLFSRSPIFPAHPKKRTIARLPLHKCNCATAPPFTAQPPLSTPTQKSPAGSFLLQAAAPPILALTISSHHRESTRGPIANSIGTGLRTAQIQTTTFISTWRTVPSRPAFFFTYRPFPTIFTLSTAHALYEWPSLPILWLGQISSEAIYFISIANLRHTILTFFCSPSTNFV